MQAAGAARGPQGESQISSAPFLLIPAKQTETVHKVMVAKIHNVLMSLEKIGDAYVPTPFAGRTLSADSIKVRAAC